MPNSEDLYFGADKSINCCSCCGAGLHNNYQHSSDCIINLPRHSSIMIARWKAGGLARKTYSGPDGGEAPPIPQNLTDDERTAFIMGSNFAGFQMLEETVAAKAEGSRA